MKIELVFIIGLLIHLSEGYLKFDFNLCGYFIHGGTCQETCKYEARHKWGLNFCAHNESRSFKCCIPLDHPLVKAKLAAEAASKTTTSPTTETPTTSTSEPTTTTIVISTPSPTTKTTQKDCGYSKPRSRVRRLVGGKRAQYGAWTWQAALRMYNGRYTCGAVVISDRWLLTAAHCVQLYANDTQLVRVFVGEQKLSYDENGQKHSKAIQQIIMHEDFQTQDEQTITDLNTDNVTTVKQFVNDLALIELQESLEFSKTIQPVCLPIEEDNHPDKTNPNVTSSSDVTTSDNVTSSDNKTPSEDIDYNDCWVAGWGENSDSKDEHAQYMKEVQGAVIDHVQCGKLWGTNFTDDIICFKSHGRSGPCKGDSGGGVSCRRTDGRYSLVGIISWGRQDCVHEKHPSVLTNVQAYQNWIKINTHSGDDV
ncbi:Tryptase beta-2 [Mactra antiquata]